MNMKMELLRVDLTALIFHLSKGILLTTNFPMKHI